MIDVVFLLLFFFMLASRIGPGAGIVVETSGGPGDSIILRPAADADVSRIVEIIGLLRAEGFDRVLIAE